ncbi:hypothetical protein [Streptomyces anulatus]|uniref:Uncharacterized protein n=1 Tax=Streptomyces anulatus TaxID=1892 RepID=A0A7K3R7J3_STRAQ|nr:hypothetical protein [Streptomyces anulatus]NEB97981.1 hypothetical protein [Streptomyces anulatus]NED24124.1 hypothetical protein [Streptomyces anulatus]
MFIPALGGLSILDAHLFATLARETDSRKKAMIPLAVLAACVINGDTVTGVLRQATWLVVVLIVLIAVQAITAHLPHPRVKSSSSPDISG